MLKGYPCGSAGKESACHVGDLGSIPGLGRFPGEGKDCPLQHSGLENSRDCMVLGVAESDTTEHLPLSPGSTAGGSSHSSVGAGRLRAPQDALWASAPGGLQGHKALQEGFSHSPCLRHIEATLPRVPLSSISFTLVHLMPGRVPHPRKGTRTEDAGNSLVVQWLRSHFPMQGTWVRSLVRELRSHTP